MGAAYAFLHSDDFLIFAFLYSSSSVRFLSKITSLEPSDHSLKLESHSLCLSQFLTGSLAFRFCFFQEYIFWSPQAREFIEHSGKGTC